MKFDVSVSQYHVHWFAAVAVSRTGKSFDARFEADLEEGSAAPPTPRADISDDYSVPKTFLPMRLANLQTTYHASPLPLNASSTTSVLPDDVNAQTSGTKPYTGMEIRSSFHRSHSFSVQSGLWAWLRGLFGKALEALSCFLQRNLAPSKGSTFSESQSSAQYCCESHLTCDDTSCLSYSKPAC